MAKSCRSQEVETEKQQSPWSLKGQRKNTGLFYINREEESGGMDLKTVNMHV